MTRPTRNRIVAAVLVVGLAAGLFLVVTGGDGSEPTTTTTTEDTTSTTVAPSGDPLPLEDTSQAAIESLTGLALPDTATDFLTARSDDARQLDVTFLMPSDAVAGFITASGLPQPVADERVVIHSSPLWKLNPAEGSPVSGTSDTYDSVRRAVELVTEQDGTVRARIVVTAA